jgi:outer membrane protein TolC
MKKCFFVCTFLILLQTISAQLTLDQCKEKARLNYPQIKQLDLVGQTAEYNLSNAGKVYLPQVNLTAKATYQSDAVDVTIPLPSGSVGIHQGKDQYQAALEVTQLVWDGGATHVRKNLIKSNAEVDKQKIEVDLHTLTDRVNQLYFGLLLLKEQEVQLNLLENDLQTNLNKLKANLTNGVVSSSDVEAFQVELLGVVQKRIELQASGKIYRTMLSALTGEVISESTVLIKPLSALVESDKLDNRPEIKLIDLQKMNLDQQGEMDKTNLLPKVGLFLQGGYGRPGLNMLSDQFAPFYIGGIRLNWSLSNLYTRKNTLAGIQAGKRMLESAQETFVLNTQIQKDQQQITLEKLKNLIRSDDEMLRLRTSIRKACEAKLSNGIATADDLLRELNAESNARQQKTLHELQLLLQIETINFLTNQN